MPVIESIPNISEGRRADVIARLVEGVRRAGARVLDVSSDASHNRSVITLAGDAASVKAGVLALFARRLSRRSTSARIRASTRAWARSTWCRSCRSRA